MKKIFFALAGAFLFISYSLSAQSKLPEYGEFTAQDLAMKECAFDPDAEAIVLLDDAFSNYDDEYRLITTRRIRIKILNDRGIDRGTIAIPFYSKDKFEYIHDIEGMSFTNGQAFNLDRKSIFTEKVNERYSLMKFAMPNVKVGTIIEYKYESVMKNYNGLDDWMFQTDIPTLKSCYLLQILPSVEFAYVVTKKNDYKIKILPKPDVGQIYFEMENVAGLKDEPYMDAMEDYQQKVEFQFAGYQNVFGSKQKVNETWKAIAYNLSTEKALGGSAKKDLPKIDEVKLLADRETTATGKMKVIFEYVKNNFTWNHLYGKYAIDGLKKVWEKKEGSVGEINLVLINLLQTFDIESYPLLVSDRNFGKIDPQVAFVDRFRKTVAYVVADGKNYILDATDKFSIPDLTPYPLLNTYGLIVDKKTKDVMLIESHTENFNCVNVIKAALDNEGSLKGTANISAYKYAKEEYAANITHDEKAFVKKIETNNPGVTVDDFSSGKFENGTDPLLLTVAFTNPVGENGGFVLLNYNLFTGLQKNPFTRKERFTNINFGYPYNISTDITITLPAGAKVENLPPVKRLITPEKEISVVRELTQTGNELHIKIDFAQTVTLVSYEEYANLKYFYELMTNLLNEPVTIKLQK